jgi:hypothetical protein
MTLYDELPDIVRRDGLSLFVGKYINGGIGRSVYNYSLDSRYVIKIETASRSFQNQMEWQIWTDVRDTKWAKWFAPCIRISSCGMWMLQEKTEPLPEGMYPDRIPNFFTDLKYANYGYLNGQVVAHDYGYTFLNERAFAVGRMCKSDWWR